MTTANELKLGFTYYVAHPPCPVPSAKMRGVYVGKLNKACGGKENRKLVIKFLTGHTTSTKEMLDAEWQALRRFCDGKPAEPLPPAELERHCAIILGEVVKQDGQLTFAEAENA